MALIVKDRVKETTTTTGTGTVTLAGASTGFQSFAAIGNGNTTYYAIESGNNYEVGLGTYTASGTTLSRDTVLESSNSGSAITLAGTSDVFCTYPAEKSVLTDAIGTAAALDTGISNTNVPKFTSGVADDDFLRVDGTAIEGRSAAEVLSDIGAITASSTDTLTNKSIAASQLTGALPAIDGSALTGISGGGVTHLGTITTTSGTSQALAAQNFSLYNQIWIVTDNVSSGGSADFQVGFNGDAVINTSGAIPAASGTWAWFRFDLRTNVFNQTWLQSTATTSGSGTFDNIPTTGGYYNLGTNYRAVTSGAITIAMEGQTFDAGSAEIYGVK